MGDADDAAWLAALIAAVAPPDAAAMVSARARQDQLTKPTGSLSCLEDVVIQLAGATGQPLPDVTRKAVITLAGDHGVTAEGVRAPPAVTPQMVINFLRGGAAINALAGWAGEGTRYASAQRPRGDGVPGDTRLARRVGRWSAR